jgi:4-amino-4-deoxy-L-arabinose transferase-like glycosyltransferase
VAGSVVTVSGHRACRPYRLSTASRRSTVVEVNSVRSAPGEAGGVGSPAVPANTRPARLPIQALSLVAAVLYVLALTRGAPHYYYSAAVRSMSGSWHNFFYGAFDPSGTITVDKLPGWLWVHALFVRVLGMHDWVLLLPEALAATATVPLLYGAVRRWAGPRAAFGAVLVFLLTPATFAAAHVNIADTLLVLCVVAAAYALVRALDQDGWGWLLLSAVLLGVAFQMKMLQALLVLPAWPG